MRLTGDNAVIIAAGGAHFGTVGEMLRWAAPNNTNTASYASAQPADHLLQATQGAIQGVNQGA